MLGFQFFGRFEGLLGRGFELYFLNLGFWVLEFTLHGTLYGVVRWGLVLRCFYG